MAETTAAPAKAAPAKKVPAQKKTPATNAAKFVAPADPVEPPPAPPGLERAKPKAGSWVAIRAQVLSVRGPGHKGHVLVEVEARGDVQEVLVPLGRIIGPTEAPLPDEPTTRGKVVLVGGVAFQLVDTTHARGWQGIGEEKLRTWDELHALGMVVVL